MPDSVVLVSEGRSIEPGWFSTFRAALETELSMIAQHRRVEANVEWLTLEAPRRMDSKAISNVLSAAHNLGHEVVELASYAGHDAVQMTHLGACAMIFVPSRAGRSHCPEEWTDLDDITTGVSTLAATLLVADRS